MKTNIVPGLLERGNAPVLVQMLETDPVFSQMVKVPAGTGKHGEGETTLQHTLTVLQRASNFTWSLPARFHAMIVAAALFHDVGKLFTPRDQWPKHIGHDRLGATALPEIMAGWPEHLVRVAALVAAFHMRVANWASTKVPGRLKLVRDILVEAVDESEVTALAVVTAADSPERIPDWRMFLVELGDYRRALALPVESLVHPSRLEGKSPEVVANILWEERLEWVIQEAAIRQERRDMYAVLSTSDIYEWRPHKYLTAEDEPNVRWRDADGASITTGRLEAALAENRIVLVATTKEKWGEHEMWWLKLMFGEEGLNWVFRSRGSIYWVDPQPGQPPDEGAPSKFSHAAFLSNPRGPEENGDWRTGWTRLFKHLDIPWPQRHGEPVFWTTAQAMLLRRLNNGDELTAPWPPEEG
jgi:hypothetical protein